VNRERIEAAILARLTEKSSHDYQWPRWAAAYEASEAIEALIREAVDEALEAAAVAIESRTGNFTAEFVNGMDHAAEVVRSHKGAS